MPSGLIALLDDVAGIAKMAATSLDDVAAAAGKAGTKAAGVVIDDQDTNRSRRTHSAASSIHIQCDSAARSLSVP